MAEYEVSKSKFAVLQPGQPDIVSFNPPVFVLEVRNRSSSDIFIRTDGIAPEVDGDDNDLVEPGEIVRMTRLQNDGEPAFAEIRLVSRSEARYALRGMRNGT